MTTYLALVVKFGAVALAALALVGEAGAAVIPRPTEGGPLGYKVPCALARPGRYQSVRDNLRVKDVRLGQGDNARRFVVCHNPAEAARYLRQTKSGRLQIDRRKVAAEERLDGKYLLSSSDPDLSAEEIALGYKNLREAERSFRDLKSTLELRPVFHRLEHRIRAHLVVCWLALLLIRIAERKTGQSWQRIATELQRLHLVSLHGEAGAVQQTTRPTDAQQAILAALQVEPPPRITALEPA